MGNQDLKNHYEKQCKNASYLSNATQNELINCCGEVISDSIVEEVKKAKFFSIFADEAMDFAKKEQLALVLRFLDCQNNQQEHFIGFIHLKSGLSGQHLAEAILSAVDDLGLNIEDCRG